MQTTLVGTRSPVEVLEARSNASAFSSRSPYSDLPARRDSAFGSRNLFATPENGNGNNRAVIEAMVNSKIYQEYEKAFCEATGMPVALRAVESRPFSQFGNRTETAQAQTISCVADAGDTAVPVRLGDRLIGFLETAQQGTEDGDGLDATFFQTEAPIKQHESVVKLLSIFAEHLSLLSNQVVMQQKNSEPPAIVRAKEYIHEHQSEDLSLGQVAKAVNTSTFYFCKMFKKVTGINFTDYLSRVRIERARNLLLNRNLRVSEIAFEVGFQSLTHFNRVFKKILGQSPTEYRAQLPGH